MSYDLILRCTLEKVLLAIYWKCLHKKKTWEGLALFGRYLRDFADKTAQRSSQFRQMDALRISNLVWHALVIFVCAAVTDWGRGSRVTS